MAELDARAADIRDDARGAARIARMVAIDSFGGRPAAGRGDGSRALEAFRSASEASSSM